MKNLKYVFFLKYLLFSELYDQMTSETFETIMINMWFENQQKYILINLKSKVRKVMFRINFTQYVNVLRGAYPTSA